MARPLVLSNGNLLVNFDEALYLRDLYYPYVGMDNHIAGHHSAFGFWDNGCFSWIHQANWKKTLDYVPQALVTNVKAVNQEMGLEVSIADAVHPLRDVYLKHLRIVNCYSRARQVRIFFYNDFYIGGTDVGNTAFYDPESGAMCHYRRDYYLLVGGSSNGGGIAQYGVHKRGSGDPGRHDPEDGWLEGKAVDQGSVNSCLAFVVPLEPSGCAEVSFWIIAGRSMNSVRCLNDFVRESNVANLIHDTKIYWQNWLGSSHLKVGLLPDRPAACFKRSLLVTRSQIDNRGGILAANDTDILATNRDHYSYVWPRDGALVAYAMDLCGFGGVAERFFKFSARVLTREGYFMHKYNPDGTAGSSWHPRIRNGKPELPIQEDETGLVLWVLWQHHQLHPNIELLASLYSSLIKPAGGFLAEYRDPLTGLPAESWDLWEERWGIFTFTVSAVWAGLNAAANIAALVGDRKAQTIWQRAAVEIREALLHHLYSPSLGRFIRGLSRGDAGEMVADVTLDASLWGVSGLGLLPADDPRIVTTMEAIADKLWIKTKIGGIARYAGDYYFRCYDEDGGKAVPGNPWVICTLWLADWYIARAHNEAELAPGLELIEWACRHTGSTGHFPEQIHPCTGKPLSVSPLTWSHATYCYVAARYLRKREELRAGLHLS